MNLYRSVLITSFTVDNNYKVQP